MAAYLAPIPTTFLDDQGNPLSGGKVYTYASGTTTPQASFTDATGSVANTNPVILDSAGRANIYFGSSAYSLKVTTSGDVFVRQYDNVSASAPSTIVSDIASTSDMSKGVALVGGAGRVIDSIAILRTLPKTGSPRCFVTGYYAAGDGGGGQYYYDSSDTTTADNGGTVIVAADGGRWKLQPTGSISVKQFGAKGDWNGTTGTDDQAAINAAIAVATTYGPVEFPEGSSYRITQRLTASAVGVTLRGRGYGGMVGTPRIVWDGAIGGHMCKVVNGAHFPTVENLFFDANLKADLCLWIEAVSGSATQNPRMSNLMFLGYRLYGLVLGMIDTVNLQNGQMGDVYATNLQWRGGGLAGAIGVLINAQNIENVIGNAWYFDPWPDPGIYFNHLTHIFCRAGGLDLTGLLTTRATSYAIDTWDNFSLYNWRAEDRFLIRQNGVDTNAPSTLSNVVQRPDASYLAADQTVVCTGFDDVVSFLGCTFQGSVILSPSTARKFVALGVHFPLGGSFVFQGPQAQSGFMQVDSDKGILHNRGSAPAFKNLTAAGGVISEFSARLWTRYTSLPTGATPDISNGTVFGTNNGGATTITNFLNLQSGQYITLIGADGGLTTVANSGSIKLAGGVSFVLGQGDTITLVGDASGFAMEVARSNN